MAYPTGSERTTHLNRISDRIHPKELELIELISKGKLRSLVELIGYGAKRQLTSDELSPELINMVGKIPGPLQIMLEPDLTQFTQLSSFFTTQMWDYSMMLAEWCLERLAENKRLPQPSELGIKKRSTAQIYVDQIIFQAAGALKHLGKAPAIGDEIQWAVAVQTLLEQVRTYCLENVLDSSIESMPQLAPGPNHYSALVSMTIKLSSAKDILSFAMPGGMEYRDVIAAKAAQDNLETALDVGTGYGWMIPALAERGLKVTAIDRVIAPFAEEFKRYYPKTSIQQVSLEDYAGKADAVVLSAAEFFNSPEHTASHIARIAKRRAIVGISVAAAPIHHFVFKDVVMSAGAFTQHVASYEPKRWARELGKHFDKVTTFCYNDRRFIIEAERK